MDNLSKRRSVVRHRKTESVDDELHSKRYEKEKSVDTQLYRVTIVID